MAIFPMISKIIIVFISITVLSSMESDAFATPSSSSSSSTTTTTPTTDNELSLKFPYRLSKERLGTKHDSLESFHRAMTQTQMPMQTQTGECDSTIKIAKKEKKSKEYTLVIVTETIVSEMNKKKSQKQQPQPQQRILLGMKNRGFGTGKYNAFGGKFLHDNDDDVTKVQETVEECACRELKEETNIKIPIERMKQSKIGIQRFTFEDDIQNEMIVHVFHTDLSSSIEESYNIIGCDEITPIWFDNFDLIPFDSMFADDSLWLTTLLSSLSSSSQQEPTTTTTMMIQCTLEINGSYHFKANCEETNTILHYSMDVRPRKINTT